MRLQLTERRRDKHFLLNQSRLKQAQRGRDKFIKAAIRDDLQIEDVFGRLTEK